MTTDRGDRTEGYEGTRPDIRALVPLDARRVLDLGCSSGALGAALRAERPVEVVGIESDAGYARDAADRLDRVVELDLDELPDAVDLASDLGSFDCVVAADVLEHLVDPVAVLDAAAALLRPSGTLVLSLPNVRHWTVARAVFLRGSWPREDAGLFDRTHLRWFTTTDAETLVTDAGLRVEARRHRGLSRVSTWFARGPLRPFLTYQILIRAVR